MRATCLLSCLMTTAASAAASTRPVVLGLTGSIGMGKSTASAWCTRAGLSVHDADACVHKLYAAGGAAVAAVVAEFGPGVQAGCGGVDRAKLSEAVAMAGRDASLRKLEQIVHPLVASDRDAFLERAARAGEWLVVLDVPLLLETMDGASRAEILDALVVVSAPADVQRARVLQRASMTVEKFEFILSKQVADAAKREAADFVIETGFAGHSAQRAQLARCIGELAATHAGRHAEWRDGESRKVGGGRRSPVVRAVSFDLDDTLVPLMPPILGAIAARSAALEEHLPKVLAAGGGGRAEMARVMTQLKAAQPLIAHDFTALLTAALRLLAEEHGDDVANVESCVLAFVRARSDIGPHLFPDAKPALAALRAANLPVGGLTNGNCDVRLHGDVSALFDFAVRALDAGASKPHAAPFWHAAAAAQRWHAASASASAGGAGSASAGHAGEPRAASLCRPCNLVHVGDDVVTDLLGALRAGCRAVLVSRPELMPRTPEQTAELPPADPSRWREVASLEEAAEVALEWKREGEV